MHTTNRRLRALPAALLLTATLSLAAAEASADAPAAIGSAPAAVLAIRASVSFARLPISASLQTAPEPAKTGFISEDLLKKATELVDNGLRMRRAPAGGALYVHVQPRGLGGVVSLKYRR